MLLTSGPFLKLSRLWLCLFSSFQKRPQRTPIIGAFPDSLLFAGSGSRTFFPHPRRAPTFEDPSSFLLLLHCVLKNSQPDSTCLFCSCIRTAEHGLAWTAALWTGARKVRCSWSYKSWLILGCLPLTFCWVAIFVQLFTCFLPTLLNLGLCFFISGDGLSLISLRRKGSLQQMYIPGLSRSCYKDRWRMEVAWEWGGSQTTQNHRGPRSDFFLNQIGRHLRVWGQRMAGFVLWFIKINLAAVWKTDCGREDGRGQTG